MLPFNAERQKNSHWKKLRRYARQQRKQKKEKIKKENRSRTNHQGAIAVSGKGPKKTAGNQAPTVPPQKTHLM